MDKLFLQKSALSRVRERTLQNEKFPKIVHLNFFAKFVSAAILSKMNEIFLGHFFPFLQISSFSKDDELITTSIETFLVSTFTFTLKVWWLSCPAVGFLSEGSFPGSSGTYDINYFFFCRGSNLVGCFYLISHMATLWPRSSCANLVTSYTICSLVACSYGSFNSQ